MKQQTEIDILLKATVKSEGLLCPGKGFTEKIANAISEEPIGVEAYKPLLPKKVLAGIVCFLGLLILTLVALPPSSLQSAWDLQIVDRFLKDLGHLQISIKIPWEVSLVLICTLVILLIQTFIITRYIQKTWE